MPLDARTGLAIHQFRVHSREHRTCPQSAHCFTREFALRKHHNSIEAKRRFSLQLDHSPVRKINEGHGRRHCPGREFRDGMVTPMHTNRKLWPTFFEEADNFFVRASVIPRNESDTGSRASFPDRFSEFPDVEKAISGREIRVVDDPVRPRKRTLRKVDPAMAQKEQERYQSRKTLSDIEISLMLCRGIEHRRRG